MASVIYRYHGGTFEAEPLLPCPFCGGEAEMKFKGNEASRVRHCTVRCKSCRVQITNGALRYGSEWVGRITLKGWNTRT